MDLLVCGSCGATGGEDVFPQLTEEMVYESLADGDGTPEDLAGMLESVGEPVCLACGSSNVHDGDAIF